ncbi:hypothetical protein LBMAG23_05970 [Bacteroidota bacterium]|nr:hypothetical protein LBMAG23_05970 [Bacteroidota bacterium]
MKFLVSIIISALLSYALGLFLPWWSVMIVGLCIGFFIPQKRIMCFLSVFIGVALFWGCFAFFISNANDHILAKRVAVLVIKKSDPMLLVLTTAMIGGISAGVAAFTGRSLAILFKK